MNYWQNKPHAEDDCPHNRGIINGRCRLCSRMVLNPPENSYVLFGDRIGVVIDQSTDNYGSSVYVDFGDCDRDICHSTEFVSANFAEGPYIEDLKWLTTSEAASRGSKEAQEELDAKLRQRLGNRPGCA